MASRKFRICGGPPRGGPGEGVGPDGDVAQETEAYSAVYRHRLASLSVSVPPGLLLVV